MPFSFFGIVGSVMTPDGRLRTFFDGLAFKNSLLVRMKRIVLADGCLERSVALFLKPAESIRDFKRQNAKRSTICRNNNLCNCARLYARHCLRSGLRPFGRRLRIPQIGPAAGAI